MIRVQKFLANQGVASRRSIEKMINAGRISVNGRPIVIQGTKIDPTKDKVVVDGKVIKATSEYIYYWVNKPVGIISASSSSTDEEVVTSLVDTPIRIYPVGRLDKDSQGLLLLTNDGELTHRLTHPKYHIDKTYQVLVTGEVTEKKIEKLRTGIHLVEGITAPAQIDIVETDKSGTWLKFIIHEGKHRQIRRMCELVNLHVIGLIRIAVGPISLGKIGLGKSRKVTVKEISILKSLVGLK